MLIFFLVLILVAACVGYAAQRAVPASSAGAAQPVRWMHPAVWVVLFFFAAPVWFALVLMRYAKEIAVGCAVLFCMWVLLHIVIAISDMVTAV